MQLTGN